MHERGEDFSLLFTPTGNELPALVEHMDRVIARVGKQIVYPPNKSLGEWIEHFNALPNPRQRWCTRLIKIVPCIAYLKQNPGTTLCIGLRADEPEREGLYGEYAHYRYPLREARMDLQATLDLCDKYQLRPRFRTDCAVCPYQRLGEWYMLWRDHIDLWMQGEAWEEATGYTFRSASRDTWPAAMKDMRSRFEAGDIPHISLKRMEKDERCKVCQM